MLSHKVYSPTLTKRLLYLMRFRARPLGFFFLSCLGTLGVWPRTLPARAREPWTLPAQTGGGHPNHPGTTPKNNCARLLRPVCMAAHDGVGTRAATLSRSAKFPKT
jgi:hypothetical protein